MGVKKRPTFVNLYETGGLYSEASSTGIGVLEKCVLLMPGVSSTSPVAPFPSGQRSGVIKTTIEAVGCEGGIIKLIKEWAVLLSNCEQISAKCLC